MTGKKKLIRFAVSLSIVSAFFVALGFTYRYQLPRLQSWLLVELESFSTKNLPVRVFPESVNVELFPLGVKFYNIRILPKKEIKKIIGPSSIEGLSVHLSWLSLIRGEVFFSNILVENPEFTAIIKKPKTNSPPVTSTEDSKKKNSFDFSILKRLPVEKFTILNLNSITEVEEYGVLFKTSNLNLTLENRFNSLFTEVEIPKLKIKRKYKKQLAEILFESQLLISENGIKVTAVKLKHKNSYAIATGSVSGDVPKLKYKSARIHTRTNTNFTELSQFMSYYFSEVDFPELRGTSSLDLDFKHNDQNNFQASFSLKTDNFKLNKFKVGSINTRGNTDLQSVTLDSLNIKNSAGQVSTKNLYFDLQKRSNLKPIIKVHRLEINQLLQNLGLNPTPMKIALNGQLPCSINLKPKFFVNCDNGQVKVKELRVHTVNDPNKTIVAFKDGNVKGSLTVDDKQVKYNAQLKIGKATGSSKGTISYKKGFKIYYNSNNFDFKNLNSLLDLKIDGKTKVSGNTQGNSHYATIDMKLNASDFAFEDITLGNTNIDLKYRAGKLYFNNIIGNYEKNRYSGSLKIDLLREMIFLNAKSDFVDIALLKEMVKDKVPTNFDFTGTGQADINLSGPLIINRLTYQLNADFFRGTLFNEPYDDIKIRFNSKKGLIKTDNSKLTKGDATILVSGEIKAGGETDLLLEANDFRLEDSANFNKLGLNLTGHINLKTQLSGPLLDPNAILNGKLSNVSIADERQKDSNFSLNINKHFVAGTGQFFGSTLSTDFHWPIDDSEKFIFKLKSEQWDFIKLFNLVSKDAAQKNYYTRLGMDINLKSPKGGFWKSSGYLTIKDVLINRNKITMSNPKPMRLDFNNGSVTSKDFRIEGLDSFAELVSKQTTKNNLNVQLNGKFDLSLASILTPLEDIFGPSSMNLKVFGQALNPKVSGAAYINGAHVKLKEFPHPFTNINADLLFSDQKVLINAAKANIADGEFRSSGSVEFKDFTNLPINIRGDFQNVNINFPEGLKTKGYGNIYVKGNWFPYELGGSYNITGGNYTKEFSNATDAVTIAPSSFLPKFLSEQTFEPIKLNLNVEAQSPIVVQNSQLQAPLNGRIKVNGTPRDLLLNGRFMFNNGGQITFRENIFELQRGSVEFVNSTADNPNLYIAAQTQIESDDINYDVNLQIQGPALSPSLKLSSSPPLKEIDLVTLLALGVTTKGLEESDAEQQVLNTSYQIGSALLASPLGKQLKNRFGVDLQISSDTEGTSGDDTSTTVPKVTLKKKFDNNLNATASRTLGNAPKTNVKSQYKFNKNFSIIGFWDSTEAGTGEGTTDNNEGTTYGIDLEYSIKFK